MKSAQMNGFTLIEVMITVAILAVVAAIAVPAYNGYIETSRLTEGWNNLYALNSAEQQHFLEKNAYFEGTSTGATETLSSSSDNLWIRAEADGIQNFLYTVNGASSTGYTAWAKGHRKVASNICLKCSVANGQTLCVKLTTTTCP